jgi:Asp-tRNA(Asn)/Glu-tRNA(Gln) amidotransferase A subunit family amidase
VLFLSTFTPVLSIPILPFQLPAAVAQQQGKETEDVPDASELAAMNDAAQTMTGDEEFQVEEATIEDIHNAIKSGELTATELVQMYLERIKAYNGQCVEYPDGFLGPTLEPMQNAGQLNAYLTINLRPEHREEWGFDERKARSITDPVDDDPSMPDALEVAAALDEHFAMTGELVGPLHGIPVAIKDQLDTFDMRTTSGADAFYANDRPPNDATVVAKLREAGAIIIGKANQGDYASGPRSSWGGQVCNPYATDRTPSSSSAGSGAIPAANLAVCAIAEDTGGSIRGPATVNNLVGIRPTIGLMSIDGLVFASLTRDTVGPICRTVMDTALLVDVMKGYDEGDYRTAASIGQVPEEPFASFADEKTLDGVRIGIVTDAMVEKSLADREVLRVVNGTIADLEGLGVEMVEINLRDAVAQHVPYLEPSFLPNEFPEAFPTPPPEQIDHLVSMFFDPSLVPDEVDVFDLFSAGGGSETKYALNRYLKERGDANIQSVQDLIENSNTFRPTQLPNIQNATTLDNDERLLRIRTLQQLVLIVMAENNLDAIIYPTRHQPVPLINETDPPQDMERPSLNSLSPITGFPAIVLPAGFSEVVFDWEPDPDNPSKVVLVGPKDVQHPIGVELLSRAFDEATLFKIGSAYEAATHHRAPPPDFGPVTAFPVEHMPAPTASAGYGVYSQKPARVEYVTEDSELVGDMIDSITLTMKRVGTINGTAEIGILNEDLSVKKLFGTLNVTDLTPTYTDYEFKLADELYTIEAGDRIGITYTGGSLESTSWISVMLDLEPEDPFDDANSYLQYHYQGAWRSSLDRDLYMTLQQTHG